MNARAWFYGPEGFGSTRGSFPTSETVRKTDAVMARTAQGLNPERMTLDDFLDDYVPRVLAPMGGWQVHHGHVGQVRREVIGFGCMVSCCPLTAESEKAASFYTSEGRRLGLDSDVAVEIMRAADGAEGPVRQRLLEGLGLAIPEGETQC